MESYYMVSENEFHSLHITIQKTVVILEQKWCHKWHFFSFREVHPYLGIFHNLEKQKRFENSYLLKNKDTIVRQ